MISREQVESLLKINGMSTSSPDDIPPFCPLRQIQHEVDKSALCEDLKTKQTRVDGLHKIFCSDESLRPKEISILGIEVDAQFVEVRETT